VERLWPEKAARNRGIRKGVINPADVRHGDARTRTLGIT